MYADVVLCMYVDYFKVVLTSFVFDFFVFLSLPLAFVLTAFKNIWLD